jgi:hypothetical protein
VLSAPRVSLLGMHPALAARARRIKAIRRRILAATLATFALAWGTVVWDGSMGATSTTVAQVTATATPTATTDSSDTLPTGQS